MATTSPSDLLKIHADPDAYYARYSLEDFADLMADAWWGGDDREHEMAVNAYRVIAWPGPECPWFEPHPTHLGNVDLKAWAMCATDVVDVSGLEVGEGI